MTTFYQWHMFHLDRRWRLVETIFSILQEIQWNKEYEVSRKIWNIAIYQNYQFYRCLCHPKLTSLIYQRFFKAHRRSHLPYSKLLSPWKYDQKHLKSQFLLLCKICCDTSDSSHYIKKSNEHLHFYIKRGCNSFILTMSSNIMLPCLEKPVLNSCHKIKFFKKKEYFEKNIINILKTPSNLK